MGNNRRAGNDDGRCGIDESKSSGANILVKSLGPDPLFHTSILATFGPSRQLARPYWQIKCLIRGSCLYGFTATRGNRVRLFNVSREISSHVRDGKNRRRRRRVESRTAAARAFLAPAPDVKDKTSRRSACTRGNSWCVRLSWFDRVCNLFVFASTVCFRVDFAM